MGFGEKTTAVEIVETYKDIVKGKNVVITGVSPKSLGLADVDALAPYAKTIIVASRSRERTEEALAETRKAVPSADIRVVTLDLMSGASIRAAAAEILGYKIPIHVLINNAGVAYNETIVRTEEGFEGQIGTNHFGHFLFTSLLWPAILQAKSDSWQPRVISLSSLAVMFGGQSRLDDIHYNAHPEEYNPHAVYSQTKTANVLFATELARRYKDSGVLSYPVHPGVIRGTKMGGIASDDDFKAWGLIQPDGTPSFYFKTIPEGASSALYAAFDPSIASQTGAFINDCAVYPESLPEYCTSPAEASKLWSISEEAWKIKFAS